MKNKTIIITGTAGNLGQVVVDKFHELGANIVAAETPEALMVNAFCSR